MSQNLVKFLLWSKLQKSYIKTQGTDVVFKLSDKKKLFVRDATGLVREAGFFDLLQFNAVSVTGVAIISGGLLLLPLMTSGAGIWESIVIGLITATFVNLTYYILSVTIPRSGGDYVYISRLLHPSLGVLAAGLTGIFGTIVLAATFGASVWVTAGLSPLLVALGQNDLASTVTTATSLTIAGILSTIFFGALLIFGGNKAFFRLNNVLTTIAIIGVIAGAAAFLSVDHATYVKLFDSYAASYGTSSSDIVSTAAARGLTAPSTEFGPVMIASALMFASFYWATQSSYLGGEIKHIRRTHFYGIMGAAVLWAVLTILTIWAAYVTVGPDLITAANYLDYLQPQLWKIPASSFFALYASIASGNPLVGILVSLAFLFGYITVTGWCYIIFSRAIFALSFDRFFPSKLADISEKYHSPVKALLVFAVLTIISLILLTNSSTAVVLYTYGVAINVVYMLVFFFSSIALAAMPYRHKSLFETSCPLKRKIAGIPAVTVIGVVSAILVMIYEYLEISNPLYFGISSGNLEAMVGTIIFFLVLYFVVRAIRKSSGINIDLVYKELPPE